VVWTRPPGSNGQGVTFHLSGLYATKLRYGGHKEPPVCRGICKFPRRRFHQNRHVVEGLEETFQGLICYTNPSIFSVRNMSFFNEHARRDGL